MQRAVGGHLGSPAGHWPRHPQQGQQKGAQLFHGCVEVDVVSEERMSEATTMLCFDALMPDHGWLLYAWQLLTFDGCVAKKIYWRESAPRIKK